MAALLIIMNGIFVPASVVAKTHTRHYIADIL